MKEKIAAQLPFVDGVVFDFGGVIAPAPQGEWPVYALGAEVGLTREMIDRGMEAHRLDFDGGKLTCEGMYRAILADNHLPLPPAQWFMAVYPADSRGWRTPDARTLEIMRWLKSEGKKVGILTNMSPQFFHDYYVPIFGEFRKLADAEVVSGLEHMVKPYPEIYHLLEQRIGLPGHRLLFLDDLERNIVAARRCGWRGEIFAYN